MFHRAVQKHPPGKVGNSVIILLQMHLGIGTKKIIELQCGSTTLMRKQDCLLIEGRPHTNVHLVMDIYPIFAPVTLILT